MSAYWLTFKPFGPSAPDGWRIENLRDLVRRFESDPATTTEWWRIAAHQQAQVGNRVYLFKQGDDPRGIFGVGTIVDGPETRGTSSDPNVRPRACIRFEKLVDPTEGFLLRLDEIDDVVPVKNITANASGTHVDEAVAVELENRLAPWLTPSALTIESGQADDEEFDPESIFDDRQRALRAIRIRRGQPVFRAMLLKAYRERCAITGCAVEDVLEAAHISPYKEARLSNHASNGLLLRADIHTLFDCFLIAIHPDTRRVVIARALQGSAYANIADRPVRRPKDDADSPSTKNLRKHFTKFEALSR